MEHAGIFGYRRAPFFFLAYLLRAIIKLCRDIPGNLELAVVLTHAGNEKIIQCMDQSSAAGIPG